MSLKTKTILSLICNATVFTVTTVIITCYFVFGHELLGKGYRCFIFFTTDANAIAAIASGLVIICDVKILLGRRTTVARAFTLLKYAGLVSLMLTFFVVLFLLIPIYGIAMQWGGKGFYNHLMSPLLTFISFVFFDPHTKIRMKDMLFSMLPMLIYGVVYFLQVVVFKNWIDFYALNSGGLWFLIMPLVIGVTYLMSLFVRFIRNNTSI